MGSTPMGGLHAPRTIYEVGYAWPLLPFLPSISPCVFNLQGRAEGVRVRVAATASETDVVACELVARELRHAPLTGQEPGPSLVSWLDTSY